MLRPRIIEDCIIPVVESAMFYHNIFDVIAFNSYIIRGYGDSIISGELVCSHELCNGDVLSCDIAGGEFENCLFYNCRISSSVLINCTILLSDLNCIDADENCIFKYCTHPIDRDLPNSINYTNSESNYLLTPKNVGNNFIDGNAIIIPKNLYSDYDFNQIQEIRKEFSEYYSFASHEDPFSSVRFRDYSKQQLLGGYKEGNSWDKDARRYAERFSEGESELISNYEIHPLRDY